jgi:hypothetical protein
MALAGVLVFTIGVGLGWLAAGTGDGGSSPPGTPSMVRPGAEPAAFGEAMERAWRTPDLGGDEGWIHAMWLRGEVLARVDSEGIRGLDPATGEQVWEALLPVESEDLCAFPEPHENATVAVLLYDSDDSGCARLVAVDLTDGKVLWTALVPVPDGDEWQNTAEFLVTEDTVALMWSDGDDDGGGSAAAAERYTLLDGERLPQLTPSAAGACWGEQGYRAGVARLLLWSRCDGDDEDDDGVWEVAAYAPGGDAEDGPEWTTRVTTGPRDVERVLSDEPLVLYNDGGVVAYAGERAGSGPDGAGDVEPLWRVREEGDIEWADISRTTGDRYLMVRLSRRDETFLLGYDLDTGERRWDRQVFNQWVAGVEGDHVLLVDQLPSYRYGVDRPEAEPPKGRLRVRWVAFSDGALATEGTIPEDLGDPGSGLAGGDVDVSSLPAWDASRLYVSVTGYADGNSDVARTMAFERNL